MPVGCSSEAYHRLWPWWHEEIDMDVRSVIWMVRQVVLSAFLSFAFYDPVKRVRYSLDYWWDVQYFAIIPMQLHSSQNWIQLFFGDLCEGGERGRGLVTSWMCDGNFKIYQSKDTLCEMQAQQPYNWTNCQLYSTIMQSTFPSLLIQTWHVAVLDCEWNLYRAAKLELLYTPSANPFYALLRRDLQVRNWRKPVIYKTQGKRKAWMKMKKAFLYNDWWCLTSERNCLLKSFYSFCCVLFIQRKTQILFVKEPLMH